jgi:divalent metal cation (Fe/Co/Zn/Cd) transporter
VSPADALVPNSAQRTQERSMVFALSTDLVLLFAMTLAGFVGGSLTMMAETVRGWLSHALDWFSLGVLRRVHRGVIADVDFGAGKVEQIANVVIAGGMLIGAGWIVLRVFQLWAGMRPLGTPIGLAFGAIVGMVNVYVNVLAWDSVRRALTRDASPIMDTQLRQRWVTLVSSAVVSVGLTVSALSTDDVIVAWADSLGTLFVASYMVVNAFEVLRDSLPDLLDRSAGADVRACVQRVLARHAGEYARARRVRTRRSGRTRFIELDLGFTPGTTMAEVDRCARAIAAEIRAELPDVDLALVASAAAPEGNPAATPAQA